MPDQADQLRKLVRSTTSDQPPGPPLVVVSGSRIGVGSTTIALQLAKSLAGRKMNVLLVDADLRNGGLTRRALCESDVTALPGKGLADVLAGRRTLLEIVRSGPAGVRIVPCQPKSTSTPSITLGTRNRICTELKRIGPRTDVIVVDAAGGFSPWTERFWQESQVVLVVTTADDVAIMDTYAMLKSAASGGTLPGVRLVVNRCDSPGLATDVHRRIGQACFRFLGELVPAMPTLPAAGLALGRSHRSDDFPLETAFADALREMTDQVIDQLKQTNPMPHVSAA